jgi:hypothetical protein
MSVLAKINPKYFLGTLITNARIYSSKIDEIITRLNSITDTEGKLTLSTGVVTQITSITTGVTLNKASGTITTVSSTLAGGTATAFTVTNNSVKSNSVILATITGYSGTLLTNGYPILLNVTPSSGSFVLNIMNIHTSNALAGTLKISFTILS